MKSPTAWLYAVEPSFRFDLADPNSDLGRRPGHHASPPSSASYFSSRAWFRVGYERQSFQGDTAPSISGVRSMP